jgi:hypothetical protein
LTSSPWGDSLTRRTVPASVYIDVDIDQFEVERAFLGLLSAFDLEIAETFPPIRGSWFRAFTARAKKAVTEPEFTARLKVERARGDAVAKLITALDGTPNALIQIGPVLLIKVDGVPVARDLTQAGFTHLEHNPTLLRDPGAALQTR